MTIWRLSVTWWIPNAANTHSEYEYVTLTALPLQQWLRERSLLIRYTYTACLLVFYCLSRRRFRRFRRIIKHQRHHCSSLATFNLSLLTALFFCSLEIARIVFKAKNGHRVLLMYNPYTTAFPYGNGMVLHFYQQQESSTTKTVHKIINRGLKTYVQSLQTGENFH